jgi:hypothetical protein
MNGYGQLIFLVLAWMLSIVLRQIQGDLPHWPWPPSAWSPWAAMPGGG